jgi:hypothetical protein
MYLPSSGAYRWNNTANRSGSRSDAATTWASSNAVSIIPGLSVSDTDTPTCPNPFAQVHRSLKALDAHKATRRSAVGGRR